MPAGVEAVRCDITEFDSIRQAVKGQEAILHLAAIAFPAAAHAGELFRINASGTFNVYQAAAEEGIRRVVSASSINFLGFFYGGVDFAIRYFPIDEEHPNFTTDAYSFSKDLTEQIGAYFWRRDGISSICLRLPSVYRTTPEWQERMRERVTRSRQGIEEWSSFSEERRQAELQRVLGKWAEVRAKRVLQQPTSQWANLGWDFHDPDIRLLASRANFWASLHAEDSAQAFEKGMLADVEGSHPLFVSDAYNSAGMEAESLARLFYPQVTERRTELKGAQSLVSIEKARHLIGFAPEHSLMHYF
jgi:nucleoside-diphosphate-sugar epimerase